MLPIFACVMGCGLQVGVAVTATAAPEAQGQTHYVMAPGDPHVKPVNSDYMALSKALSRAMAAQGFDEAKTPADGQMVVLIDWSVGDPKLVLRHAGGDVGGPSVKGAAAGGKGGMPAGGTNNAASFGFGTEGSDRGEYSYVRTVTLKAVDAAAYKADPGAKALWSMTLVSEGDTGDVPKFAPLMMAAAMPYVARTTPKVRVVLGSLEAPVKYVRGDIAAMPATASNKQ
jgi:hypothetical protein